MIKTNSDSTLISSQDRKPFDSIEPKTTNLRNDAHKELEVVKYLKEFKIAGNLEDFEQLLRYSNFLIFLIIFLEQE